MNEKAMVLRMSSESTGFEERNLIRSAQDGDTSSFELLFRRYHRRVLSVAARIVGPGEDALDVAQDVFLKLHRFLPRFRTDRKFFTWLYRIIVNASYDHLKRESRFRSVSLDDIPCESLPQNVELTEDSTEFRRLILILTDSLSHPLRTAFILRDVEELPFSEIAEILGCRQGAARSRVHQARKHLREMIGKRHPELLKGMRQ